jgi:hypothetical protein
MSRLSEWQIAPLQFYALSQIAAFRAATAHRSERIADGNIENKIMLDPVGI